MKLFALVFSVLFTVSSFAIEPGLFCQNMSWDSDRINCLKVINKGYIDPNALDICTEFAFDSDKINCANYLINKTYTNYEVNICKTQTFDSEKIRCLQEAGKPVSHNPNKMLQINQLSRDAQNAVMMNDRNRAMNILFEIERLSRY